MFNSRPRIDLSVDPVRLEVSAKFVVPLRLKKEICVGQFQAKKCLVIKKCSNMFPRSALSK